MSYGLWVREQGDFPMSFTEEELQSFNTILEQRLIAHRRDMERALDQRMNEYHRELDQRFVTVQVNVQRSVSQKLSDFQVRLETLLSEKLNAQPARIIQTFNSDIEQRQQQFEGNMDRMLAAQLLGIEQLINQYSSRHEAGDLSIMHGDPAQLQAIEVQTDLSWEDLMDVIGKALDERLSILNDAIQRSLKSLEQYLSSRLHSLRDEFSRNQTQVQGHQALSDENPTSIQEVLRGIEYLERIIESMQVAMTSNHALLSNRLYHHQQVPFERAHSAEDHTRLMPDIVNKPLAITDERITNGFEPGIIPQQTEMEEH
jgi:hypothetical protein